MEFRPLLRSGVTWCLALDSRPVQRIPGPGGDGIANLCVAQGVPAEQIGVFEAASPIPVRELGGGGNRRLDPERADTYTVGVVIQPGRDARF